MKRFARNVENANAGKPGGLRGWFGHLIPGSLLAKQPGERSRGLDRECLFWGFLGQVLRGGSCRDGLQEIQAARALDGLEPLSSSTSSYCTARRDKISEKELARIHQSLAGKVVRQSAPAWEGRRVLSVDGTGISLDDTEANQKEYPQPSTQKDGCGFPVIQVVGLHDLSSGALLRYEISPLKAGESTLLHGLDLIGEVGSGDILLFDRAYCSYLNMATLVMNGADGLGRLHGSRKIPFPKGCNDMVIQWKRPNLSLRPDYMTADEWNALPKSLNVRYVRVRVNEPGFRPEEIVVVTTMFDVPANKLMELFLRRWDMEVSLRDLKTTLGADHIRAKTPEMAQKVFAMYMIAHNLIRWTMLEAASEHKTPLKRLSFKGTVDILENWKSLSDRSIPIAQRRENWKRLLTLVASDTNTERPLRVEPRVIKKRPKSFHKMTRPRQELRNYIRQSKMTPQEALN